VNSDAFSKSERARELLTYLFEQTKNGDAHLTKGFTIAVDVFGRDENFDPNNDALVRVHMGRLRELLASYYAREGRSDALSVAIPKGKYTLQFSQQVPSISPAEDAGALVTSSDEEILPPAIDALHPSQMPAYSAASRVNGLYLAIGLVGLIAAAALFFAIQGGLKNGAAVNPDENSGIVASEATQLDAAPVASQQNSQASTRPIRGFDLLPRVTVFYDDGAYSGIDGSDAFASNLRSALSQFDTLQLVSNGPLYSINSKNLVGSRFYSVLIYLIVTEESRNHLVELRHPSTQDVIWTQTIKTPFDQEVTESPSGIELGVTEIASRIASLDGLVVNHFTRQAGSNRLFDCIEQILPGTQDLAPNSSEGAVLCLGRLLAAGNRLPLVHALQAHAIVENAKGGSPDLVEAEEFLSEVVEEALEILRTGIGYSPESGALYGQLANATLVQTGHHEKALQSSLEALSRAPSDWTLWANHARILTLAGQYEDATLILDDLAELADGERPGWAFTRFLIEAVKPEVDVEALVTASENLAGIQNPFYYMARIIAAQESVEFTSRDRLLDRLKNTFPEFFSNPPIYVQALRANPELESAFLALARKAGIYIQG
jgi:hypothetical protein